MASRKPSIARTFNCEFCGAEKTTNRLNAIYCSRTCKHGAETHRRQRMQFHTDHLEDQGFEPQAQWGYATLRSHENARSLVTYRQESTINWDED